ncbi:MAG: DUF2723 domain-containing protein, partial [Flavisolibacter sp.]|nr:DUF2723 domain-containing protein [Flavisolibacter sp.]
PFVLGILGCVFHFLKDRKDWIVTFLLFFFTGLAVVLYLNQPGNQPRERDYAYVGSFYVFAIWIGLAVVAIVRMVTERDDRKTFIQTLLYGSIASFIVSMLSSTTTTFGGAFISSLVIAAVYAAVVAGAYYCIRALSGNGANLRHATIGTFALFLIAPVLMGFQEWDDHDRSQKTLAPDMARNYLESCAPNAILFTFGDNDTYPLWYAQEVEGVRRDIRIINTSLLGIDWYVNQLRYKVNESAPIDVIWTPEQLKGLTYIMYQPRGVQDRAYDLYDVMKNVLGTQSPISSFPVRRFKVPVDSAAVRTYNVANGKDTVLPEIQIELPAGRNYLTLDQLTILNIIAANHWKRPIYFTSPYGELGFGQYLRKDGLTYRLVPVKVGAPQQNWVIEQVLRGSAMRDNNTDVMYQNLMTKFRSGGASLGGVYFDEENRRHLLAIRSVFGEAAGNMGDQGRKPEAIQLLQKAESLIRTDELPYAMTSRYNSHNQTGLLYLEAAYKAGHTQLADKIRTAIRKDLTDQKRYYDYLKSEKEEFFDPREAQINDFMVTVLDGIEQHYTQSKAPVTEMPGQRPNAADTTGNR